MRVVGLLSGVILPFLLFCGGSWFLFGVGRQLLCHPRCCLAALGGKGSKSALGALSVALAGTLGVGNIAGVATALVLGGPGAIFWMWVSAVPAMLLKYAEVVLAMRSRRFDREGKAHGGAMYYIKEGLPPRLGRPLAAVFAVLCIACAFTLGGVIQSSAAAEAMLGAFGVRRSVTGLLMGGVAAWLVLCGGGRIERACKLLVPFVCLFFTLAVVAVLILRRAALPAAFSAIFKGAFQPASAGAGVLGFLTSRALRFGVARGLISNEAGCGTAPIAHAASEGKSPAAQGVLGIVEVLVDTVLLCTLTALVILVSGVPLAGDGGVLLAMQAFFEVLGAFSVPALALSVTLFAFATLLCWGHYGAECLLYLTGRERSGRWMALLLLLACIVGAVAAPALLWELTDLVVALMTVLNVVTLLWRSKEIVAETRRYFAQRMR